MMQVCHQLLNRRSINHHGVFFWRTENQICGEQSELDELLLNTKFLVRSGVVGEHEGSLTQKAQSVTRAAPE